MLPLARRTLAMGRVHVRSLSSSSIITRKRLCLAPLAATRNPRARSMSTEAVAPLVASYDQGVSSEKMIGITIGKYFDQQGREYI